MINLPVKM